MKRFRWTRKTYKRAHHLSRLLGRFECIPFSAPPLVERYHELWDRQCQKPGMGIDPLLTPLWLRLEMTKPDGIPF